MIKIMLNAGRGGFDPGATNGIFQEKDFNLNIVLQLKNYMLRNYHVDVSLSRYTDTFISLEQRTILANDEGISCFLSIHMNSGGGSGFESFVFRGPLPSSTLKHQRILHQSIMDSIGDKYNIIDRGTQKADYVVLRKTLCHAFLLHILFIDNDRDLRLLCDSTFIDTLIAGIGDGLSKSLNLPKKQPRMS